MVTAEQFIKSYLSNKGDTPAIAKELGVTPPTVASRVIRWRKAGVKLPKYGKTKKLNVIQLNNLIKEMRAK